ncbi:MAG: YcjF family protein [Gammaproteobacteria bacterium]
MSDSLIHRLFEDWPDRILKPKVSGSRLHAELQKARQGLPVPVFWLLGKTQSGKTSIIQALTGSTQAEIGEGFKACTRCARVYDFPDADTAFIRFLDTRGLGESEYDPSEDIAWCREQAHLLMVVIKAMDHELDAVISTVRTIALEQPEWPILVVQTCLHEGYISKITDHALPYPYSTDTFDGKVPADLTRSLRVQREQFNGLNVSYAVVDLTQEDDSFTPRHYGLEALWDTIEKALPLGLRQMLKQNPGQSALLNDIYADHARPHVISYAVSAGLLAATPIPVVGAPMIIALQGKLFHSIGSIYGLPLTRRSVSEIASAVGIGSLSVGYGVRELVKFVPGWGSAVAALSTAAITYALGMTLCFYYAKTRQGEAFTPEMLKSVYSEQLQLGRQLLRARFKQES